MSEGFYLGKEYDPKAGKLGDRIDLDPADLLTHGLIVGMTGSGKTGLAIALIEEALRQGDPGARHRPQGRPRQPPAPLRRTRTPPRSSPGSTPRRRAATGKTVEGGRGARRPRPGRRGLAEWGLGAADVGGAREVARGGDLHPGLDARACPLNVLQSLEAPSVPFDSAEEDLRDEIAGIVAGLLGLAEDRRRPPAVAGVDLPLEPRSSTAWRAGKGLTLESLDRRGRRPAVREDRGAARSRASIPRKERQGLMMALNNLLASPSFEAWREGEPLDVDAHAARGRTAGRGSRIVYTAHLSDEERLFVTALLLDKVKTWMRRQPGTTELRALVYMDEIFGYFPPHPRQPADQAPAPHAAQAGARPGRRRRARHPEPGGPRLQGPRQHRARGSWARSRPSRTASGCAKA